LTESNLIVASLWRQRIKQSLKEGYARGLFMKTLIFSYVQAALSHLAHTTGGSVVWNTCGRQIGSYEFLPADAQSTCLSLYAPSSLRTS
jgi:hypothetical protein